MLMTACMPRAIQLRSLTTKSCLPCTRCNMPAMPQNTPLMHIPPWASHKQTTVRHVCSSLCQHSSTSNCTLQLVPQLNIKCTERSVCTAGISMHSTSTAPTQLTQQSNHSRVSAYGCIISAHPWQPSDSEVHFLLSRRQQCCLNCLTCCTHPAVCAAPGSPLQSLTGTHTLYSNTAQHRMPQQHSSAGVTNFKEQHVQHVRLASRYIYTALFCQAYHSLANFARHITV